MLKFKRQTPQTRRRSRSQVLEVRVMSPRIAWLGFLKVLGGLTKLACVLAIVTAIGWSVWQGVQRAFYQNSDFRLQVIELNPNPVIDEAGVVEAAEINLTASLFQVDVDQVAARLKALPGISDARAERHLPGKLVVQVTTRVPRAWISCSGAGLPEDRRVGAMLVDADGAAYPCPEMQLESAMKLPIIRLPFSEELPIQAGAALRHPELQHCLRLLASARAADSDAMAWIESVEQVNSWSLRLLTRQGTAATFGLGDHVRQIQSLRSAMDHSSQRGYSIDTINLIPKHNIPITVREETHAPPRAILVPEPTSGEAQNRRRSRDLSNLRNPN
jgi:hypothetical protein